MSRVCYAFQRGECTRGDQCRFEHTAGGGDGGSGGYRPRNDGYSARGGRPSDDRGAFGGDRPRGICYAFQRGECDRGASCRFSHVNGDGGAGGGYGGRQPRTGGGTGVCYAFQRGQCDRGDACRYSHDASGNGGAGAGASFGGARSGGGDRPRGYCHAFQRGECTRGDSCRFIHELEPKPAAE